MLKYLAKRIGRSILTLFIIVTLVFCLLRLMPVEGYFANYEKMTEAQIQAGLQSMGLLDPLPVQIGRFWKDALHGDLGVSHIYKVNVPVTDILAQKLPISIQMGVLAMLLSLVLGIPLGLVMGRYKGRWPDKLGTAVIVSASTVATNMVSGSTDAVTLTAGDKIETDDARSTEVTELIFCGDNMVYMIDAGLADETGYKNAVTWSWDATTAAATLGLAASRCNHLDDCKPVDNGKKLLVTSSYNW